MTAETVRGALGRSAAAIDVEVVVETGSTNSDLLARARAPGATTRPRLLVAEHQSAGRGRHGRAWSAARGASLTFSLAWPLRATSLSGLSLAVGTAVAEAIGPGQGTRQVGIKWPNDLWLVDADGSGRKLGGILIETVPVDASRVAVVGIGLNVLEQRVADAGSGVAWLREIDAGATPLDALGRVVPALLDALVCFDDEGFGAFAARFTERDLLRGRPVRCGSGTDATEGVAMGVSAQGELLVRTTRGIEAIGSGEVSVRLAGAGAAAPAVDRARSPC
jgi:BirA family biotin operon repressor/biotin-[acetyl-CoA-carboxylase] ligase